MSGGTLSGSLIINGGATSLSLTRTASSNVNILFEAVGGSVYAGKGAESDFVIGGGADLGSSSNQWMKVNSSGVTAPTFIGNINASSLNTGTVPNARITGSYTGLASLTGTGNVDFARFIGNAGDTVAAPSITWTGDLNTGIYRPAASQVAITTGGVQRALFNSSGVSFNGTTTVSGDINGTSATFSIKASGTDVFRMSGVNPVISTKSTGTIYLRPNGSSSSVNEVTINSTGIKVGTTNVSLDGHTHSQYITAQRAITDTYTGSNQTTSVSQYGTDAMYNVLLDGNANTLEGIKGAYYRNRDAETAGYILYTTNGVWDDIMPAGSPVVKGKSITSGFSHYSDYIPVERGETLYAEM